MLDKMNTCLPDHSKCDQYTDSNAGIKCLLPLLHADKDSLQNSCKIQKCCCTQSWPCCCKWLRKANTHIWEGERDFREWSFEKHVNDKLQELLNSLWRRLMKTLCNCCFLHENNIRSSIHCTEIERSPKLQPQNSQTSWMRYDHYLSVLLMTSRIAIPVRMWIT